MKILSTTPTPIKWKLNVEEVSKWIRNLIIFLIPVILIYLTSVIEIITKSGVSLASFRPTPLVVGAMALYLLNGAVDLLRKLSATK